MRRHRTRRRAVIALRVVASEAESGRWARAIGLLRQVAEGKAKK
jgi:hypothetical protein